MSQEIYSDTSWNPLTRDVVLTAMSLKARGRVVPLHELHLLAMADAYQRGRWLGGGGTERPLERLPESAGFVPVTRITGSCVPVRTRRAAEFARKLGELAVARSGGPRRVAEQAAHARAEGIPLWIARRSAPGPAGPIVVAVDRRSVRVDVLGPGAPAVRLRSPGGVVDQRAAAHRGLTLKVGEDRVELTAHRTWPKSRSSVVARHPVRQWELRRASRHASTLLADGQRVAQLQRPSPRVTPHTLLLPLAHVEYHGSDPLDAVLAQLFAVSFGLGDATGTVRFARPRTSGTESIWDEPWYSHLGNGRDDNGSGGSSGDGWGADGGGGDGGDGGGGDGGGGGGDGGG